MDRFVRDGRHRGGAVRVGGRLSVAVMAGVLLAGLLAPVSAAPVSAQVPSVDYDVDDDGLIEVSSLAQLNAIRWDLDGDGTADVYPADSRGNTGHDPQGAAKHAAAFPNAAAAMGCPSSGCDGYELSADLDFDTNASGTADAGDAYWNGGKGWVPLMGGEAIYDGRAYERLADQTWGKNFGQRPHSRARMFTGVFEGNGRTIANLFIDDRWRFNVGLFGYVGPGAHVRNVGLTAPNSDSRVRGAEHVGALAGDVEGARVSGVYSDVDVTGRRRVGGLVGTSWRHAFIIESYATGDVAGVGGVGGLVGMLNYAGAAASYATGDVTVTHCYGGGLAGYRPGGHVRATYATGSVTNTGAGCTIQIGNHQALTRLFVGGLIGSLAHAQLSQWMRASYAIGQVSGSPSVAGGLAGDCESTRNPRDDGSSYWDVEASGLATSFGCGVGYTTAQLQAPTGYTGIYADWNVDVDVGGYYGAFDGPGDDPWDFGTSSQYPVLKYCAAKPGIETADGAPYCPLQPANQRPSSTVTLELGGGGTQDAAVGVDGEGADSEQQSSDGDPPPEQQPADQEQPPTVDYDVDDDGLIEVSSLAQLNAIRWDLDGDGTADVYPADQHGNTGHDPQGAAKHAAAFPNAAAAMGCPSSGCSGYELSADLDFDTNASGSADAGDEFWNGGKGWIPLMGGEVIDSHRDEDRFSDTKAPPGSRGLQSHGQRPNPRAKMFTGIFEGNGRTIANLFIDDPARWFVGLFGYIGPGAKVRNVGLSAPNSDSRVRGNGHVGALAGDSEGARVSGVWSDVDVTGARGVGGLVGVNWRQAFVIESYATGDVVGGGHVGGLVGMLNVAGAAASYATGDVTVTGDNPKWNCYGGGLVGLRSGGHVRATYATGSVTGTGNCRLGSSDGTSVTKPWIGGLIGALWHPGLTPWLRASYAVGQVSAAQGAGPAGGLTGSCEYMHPERVGGSNYWDTEASGIATSSACSVGYTTAQLQAPTGYTGIYADWNVDVDVGGYHGTFDGPGDDPWDFGTSSQYPVLKYCAAKPGIETADGGPYCPLQPANQRPSLTVTLEDSDVGTQDPDIDADVEQPPAEQQQPQPDEQQQSQLADQQPVVVSEVDDPPPVVVHEPDPVPVVPVCSGRPTLSVADASAVRGEDLEFVFGLSCRSSGSVKAYFYVMRDGAIDGSGQILTIGAGEWARSVMVPTADSETVSLGVPVVLGAANSKAGTATGTVVTATPSVVSVAAGADVVEGAAATFVVSAVPLPSVPLVVSVSVSAVGGFGAATGVRSVTVPTSGSVLLSVATAGDSVDEADGSVTATLAAGDGYGLGTARAASVGVADDDDPLPEVSVTAGSGATEGSAAVFTVSASSPPAVDLAVGVAVAASGDFGVAAGARTVTIPEGATSATLVVDTADDGVDEPDGSVTATLRAGGGYVVGVPASRTVTVADDDDPPPVIPEVSIAAGGDVVEGASAVFTLSASPTPNADVDVDVSVSAAGEWGVAGGSRTVRFAAGAATATLRVPTADDEVDEADGSVSVSLDAPGSDAGYTVSARHGVAAVGVADDDVDPLTVYMMFFSRSIEEDGAGYDNQAGLSIGLTRTLRAWETVTVPLSVTGGEEGVHWTMRDLGDPGAVFADDFEVVFGPGGQRVELALTAVDDSDWVDEEITVSYGTAGRAPTLNGSTEGVILGASWGADGTERADGSTTVVIVDGDVPPPQVGITAAAGGTEGTAATFTIASSAPAAADLDVAVDVAASGEWGAAVGAATVTIPKGATQATLTVATVDDSVDEADGSITVTVAAGSGYTVGPQATRAVQILDDDDPPPEPVVAACAGRPIVSVADAEATRGDDLEFVVSLSCRSAHDVTVYYFVVRGGAYSAGARATIASGDTHTTVSVPTAGAHSTIGLNILYTIGAANHAATATSTITD